MTKYTDEELNSSVQKCASDYDEGGFWSFVKKTGGKVGKGLLQKAFLLYYVLKKDGVPITAKGMIMGALAYLVMPVDLIPDIIPVIGWSDDAGAIAMAINQLSSYIDADVENQAESKVEEILG